MLEAQPVISASTHCAHIVDELGATIGETPAAAARPPSIDFQHAVTHHPMPTASLVFRRELMPTPPAWATGLYMLDWPFMAELASRGNIQVFPKTWSAYRSHSGGMWTSAPHGLRLRADLSFYNRIRHHFPAARSTVLLEKRKAVLFELFRLADRNKDCVQARFWLWCYFCSKPAPWRLPRHQVRAIARSMIGWPRIGA